VTETSIHRHFNHLDDPRLDRRKKYPLIHLIFIAFCAVLCGAEDWVSITRFGKARFNWLSQFIDLTNGIPSHDTFNRVFALLDTSVFVACFIGWAAQLAEKAKKTVAIDGKSLRATKNKVSNLGPIHIVTVWCCENQLALGQQIVSGKSNEITAIPLLLDLLDLEGATVTIDAMGCQKEISEKIREKNADYIFSLKGNHSNLHDDVRLYFESLHQKKLGAEVFHRYQVEQDHGRIEERDCWSVDLPKGLHSDGWNDLASIVMVRSKQTNTEKPSEEDRYFITSLKAQNINGIAQSIREHWQVEHSLHWRLDVSFNEDQWRSKLGNAAANIAVFNKMALNLLKKETTAQVGIKNKRLMAGWDETYLTKVIMCLKN
jgi:predicted transposase YbfD/YdcC